ncbi:MAG: hypothetical protein R3335_09095 [Anaerolineales bacterium]|nr:hypothetical protein [Anaerolineales bacterium]
MEFIGKQDITVRISEMTWYFSTPVIDAFKDMGISIPEGLTSFLLKVLANNLIREGSIDLLMIGLGLRIVKKESMYTVDLIEESEAGSGPEETGP